MENENQIWISSPSWPNHAAILKHLGMQFSSYNYFDDKTHKGNPIKFNWKYRKLGLGSAIFIHLTKNYIPTAGCIGLAEKDFLILIKLIKKNTFIKIL